MKFQKTLLIAIVTAVFAIAMIAATTPELDAPEATLTGTVVDAMSGEGIPGADVSIEEAGLSAQTDEYGTFSFSEVEPGSYTLVVDAADYATAEESIEIEDERASVVIELEKER